MAKTQFYKSLKKDEEFMIWFWEGENANELIMFLNERMDTMINLGVKKIHLLCMD